VLVVAALSGACSGTPVSETPVRTELVTPQSCKPEPPVAIDLASRRLADGRYEITATATPKATVDSLDLRFVLPPGATIDRPEREAFGATATAQRRVMTAIVELRDRSSEVSAVVAVPVEGIAMTKSATVAFGEPKPVPRTKVYAMPDGERAREVRP